MSTGFKAWNASFQLIFDAEVDLAAQELGRTTVTGAVAGSVSVPVTGSGNLIWFYLIPGSASTDFFVGPTLTKDDSANTISWSYDAALGNAVNPNTMGGTLVYGRY